MAIIKIPDPNGGPKRVYGLYDDRHCLRMTDLLSEETDLSWLTAKGVNLPRHFNSSTKHKLARRIIADFLGKLLDHLIATGDHFQFPVNRFCRLRILALPEQAVESILRRRRYQDVDVIASDGRIYELVFEYERYRRHYRRPVRMDRARYLSLVARVNAGQRYDRF